MGVGPLFRFHRLNMEGITKATAVAELFDGLLTELESLWGVSTGREAALARTHLEEACFYAKKQLAINPMNQE